MSEEEFWNCTHRKLQGLLKVHNEIHEQEAKEEEIYGDTISL